MANQHIVEKIGEIDVVCPKCGYDKSNLFLFHFPYGDAKAATCKKCKTETYKENFEQAEITLERVKQEEESKRPIVTCPFCQSTDCKKISGASKIGKVALFGLFAAGSVSKTWHCNNCGSNFG